LSERIRGGERLPKDVTEAQFDGDPQLNSNQSIVCPESGVRERGQTPCPIALSGKTHHPPQRTPQIGSQSNSTAIGESWTTRCNGSCSEERGTHAKRTRAGKSGPFAGRERDCCGVFASLAARSMTKLSPSYKRSPKIILTGRCLNERCKTSTFAGRLSITPS
jgi:hypothetical protein